MPIISVKDSFDAAHQNVESFICFRAQGKVMTTPISCRSRWYFDSRHGFSKTPPKDADKWMSEMLELLGWKTHGQRR